MERQKWEIVKKRSGLEAINICRFLYDFTIVENFIIHRDQEFERYN